VRTPDPAGEPGGETPRAPARPSIGLCTTYKDKDVVDRSIDLRAREDRPIDDDEFWKAVEAEMDQIRRRLWSRATSGDPLWWPTDPPDVRDVELIARLAVLSLNPAHHDWIVRLVQAVRRNKPRKALAFLQSVLPDFCPADIAARRLLASIVVPEWIFRAARPRPREAP
jgi:hypothetical protein